MRVKTKYNFIVNIFGIYNIQGKTLFLELSKSYNGLIVLSLEDFEVVDPNISNNFIYDDDGIYHSALIRKNLLNDLLEGNKEAYEKFIEILKVQKEIDYDF